MTIDQYKKVYPQLCIKDMMFVNHSILVGNDEEAGVRSIREENRAISAYYWVKLGHIYLTTSELDHLFEYQNELNEANKNKDI